MSISRQLAALMILLCVIRGASAVTAASTSDRYEALKRMVSVVEGKTGYSASELSDSREAMGWIVGVYGVLTIQGMSDASHRAPAAICSTESIPAITMARLFIKYVDDHPSSYSVAPEAPAIVSAKAAYPCK